MKLCHSLSTSQVQKFQYQKNFAYLTNLSQWDNALLQFRLKIEKLQARHSTKCDKIYYSKLFLTIYRRIYCRKLLTLSNKT